MISYLKGKIILERPTFLIIDVSGVGYKVSIIPKIDYKIQEIISLYCYQHIREDASDLYGFSAYEELELFEKLLSVNGVGPKAAMTVMSLAPTEKIIEAITTEDSNFFLSAPGIGKKVAIKIILDLKSKISGMQFTGAISGGRVKEEVVDGLVMLGYKKPEIDKVISILPKNLEKSEEQIRWCLKNLAKK
jgi:holliday junction DNA helicase RuvA